MGPAWRQVPEFGFKHDLKNSVTSKLAHQMHTRKLTSNGGEVSEWVVVAVLAKRVPTLQLQRG